MSRPERVSLSDYVATGQRFDNPIALERFPDGDIYVRDGLHRIVAVYVARKSRQLFDNEYWIKDVTYDDFAAIDLADNWLTPFDPRIEIRLPDFWRFKKDVLQVIRDGEDVEDYVRQHRHLYCRERKPSDTIEQLAARWLVDR